MLNWHYYVLCLFLVLPLAGLKGTSPTADPVLLYKYAQVIQELKSRTSDNSSL